MMMKKLGQRLLGGLLTVWLTTMVAFFALEAAPGDALTEERLNAMQSPESLGRLRAELGLDQPWWQRYGRWVLQASQGNWGKSSIRGQDVAPLLEAGLRESLKLVLGALLLCWGMVGALVVLSQRSAGTRWIARPASYLTLSLPDLFWLLLLAACLARQGWDFSRSPAPQLVLVLLIAPALYLQLDAAARRVHALPFLEAARLRGVARPAYLWRYWLPALFPVLAPLLGMSLGAALSTSLLVESVLGVNGLGPLFLAGIHGRDLPLVLAITLTITVAWQLSMLVGDLLQQASDPRLRERS